MSSPWDGSQAAGAPPTLGPRITRIDIGGNSTPDIAAAVFTPEDVARPRIKQCGAETVFIAGNGNFVFVNAPHLQARPRRVQIADVQGVAVSQIR